MGMRDAALDYAAKGYRVFPCVPNDKKPMVKDWPNQATGDSQIIKAWWDKWPDANIGVCCGRGLMALDFDLKGGARGDQDLAKLEAKGLDTTAEVFTPSGGSHVYLKTLDGVEIATSAKKLAPATDVRGFGGYVLGVGSVVDGKPYTWATGVSAPKFEDIPEAPSWLIAECGSPHRSQDTRARAPLLDADKSGIKRAIEYLKTAEGALLGNRNDTAYKVACRAKDFVPDQNAVFLLLSELWNIDGKVSPPLDQDELEATVASAFKSGTSPPGKLDARLEFPESYEMDIEAGKPVSDVEAEDDPKLLTAAELAAGDFPLPEYLIEPFVLAESVCSLYGDGGLGKTTLLMHIAVSVASGTPFFGIAAKQRPVLLVLTEDPEGVAKRQLENICSSQDIELKDIPLKLWCRWGADSVLASIHDNGEVKPTKFLDRLQYAILSLGDGPKLTLLDTLGDMVNIDANQTAAANACCKKLFGRLGKQTNSAILFTAHPSKTAMRDGTAYSGAVPWKGSVRVLNVLEPRGGYSADAKAMDEERPLEHSCLTLRTHKANWSGKQKIDLLRTLDGLLIRVDPKSKDQRELLHRDYCFQILSEQEQKGVYFVPNQGNGQKPKDLAQAVRERFKVLISDKEARGHLTALERAGRIRFEPRRNDRHHQAGYRVVRDGEAQASASSGPAAGAEAQSAGRPGGMWN